MTGRDSLDRYTRTASRVARGVIRSYSTSFGAATRLLGPRHRDHVRNVYALVRVADELVDGVGADAGATPAQQHAALERLAADTHRAMELGFCGNLVVHAFAHTAREAGIDRSLTEPFFASMRADLPAIDDVSVEAGAGAHSQADEAERRDASAPAFPRIVRYDADRHAEYVYGSAEVVGLMCLRVFVREEPLEADELARLEFGARQLGAAFQNVNFLRDLADDTTRLGRHYLGTTDRLTDADRDEWVRTIREQLADARATLSMLPMDARVGVRCALDVFEALTDRLATTPTERLYRERVSVSNPRKGVIIARAALARGTAR